MNGHALTLALSSLIAMLALPKRDHRAGRPSRGDDGASRADGDDAVTVAVLCGGIHL